MGPLISGVLPESMPKRTTTDDNNNDTTTGPTSAKKSASPDSKIASGLAIQPEQDDEHVEDEYWQEEFVTEHEVGSFHYYSENYNTSQDELELNKEKVIEEPEFDESDISSVHSDRKRYDSVEEELRADQYLDKDYESESDEMM